MFPDTQSAWAKRTVLGSLKAQPKDFTEYVRSKKQPTVAILTTSQTSLQTYPPSQPSLANPTTQIAH